MLILKPRINFTLPHISYHKIYLKFIRENHISRRDWRCIIIRAETNPAAK